MGQELRTDDTAQGEIKRGREGYQTYAYRNPTMPDGPAQAASIEVGQGFHDAVSRLLHATAEKCTAQHGRHENGKCQGAQKTECDGPGHGPEQTAFHALKREDRHVGRDDDGDGVEDGPLDFVGGVANGFRERSRVAGMAVAPGHVPHDVFHHDHRAVHDHAEIQRAKREQVDRDFGQIEKDGSEEQRERNGERNDERRARIEEEDEQDAGHQDHALGEVVHHGVQGVAKEIAAVDHGNEFHAGREDAIVELVYLGMKADERGSGVGALAHHDLRKNDIVVIDDAPVFATEGLALVPQAGSSAPGSPRQCP